MLLFEGTSIVHRITAIPVRGAPALLLTEGATRTLVLSDVHLGLGDSAERGFGVARSTAAEMARGVIALARRTRARRVIIAGDLKHPIFGLSPPLKALVFDFASTLLRARIRLDLVLGNHDAGIVPALPREVLVHSAGGMRLGDVGIFHGHCWPSGRLASARLLVSGHLHPGYRFAPDERSTSGKERCWLRASFAKPLPRFRHSRRPTRAEELIVLPAFHPLAGIEALNREAPSRGRSFLVRRFLSRGQVRAFLLDGTDVGPVLSSRRKLPVGGRAARSVR